METLIGNHHDKRGQKSYINWGTVGGVPDIGGRVWRGPRESGSRDREGAIGDGNIVHQRVIEKPIGVFRGNHFPGGEGGEFIFLLFFCIF